MSVPKKITSLYAWIATQEDGGEGLPAHSIWMVGRQMFAPMVGADLERMKSLRPMVENIKRELGSPMRLCRFQLADDLDEL